jgi:putative oxidoreductase
MSIKNSLQTLRSRSLQAVNKVSFLGPFLIRLTVGLVFVSTGWGKLHGLDDVTGFFETLGIPFPALNAAVVAGTEFFGGLLILVGLGSRLVALPLAFTMVIAILTAKWAEVDGLNTLVGFDEWSYLVMFLAIAIGGPGALSLDAVLSRWFARDRAVKLPTPLLRPDPGTPVVKPTASSTAG